MTPTTLSAGDTAWVLVAAAFVMLMVPGLALFYGGLVRTRSVLNVLMMSLGAFAVVSVQWVLLGYTLSFSPGSSLIGGLSFAGFSGVGGAANPVYAGTIPHAAFAAFQAMFAGITVALISGAVVERMKFSAFLVFGLLWTFVVYDPLAHWVWADGGWLRSRGALDFAGGTVIHISAGTSALVAAWMLGRRRDFGRPVLVPHNVPFTVLGAGLLWFGWFGFNGGSALAANDVAANAVVTTHVAAASALVVWLLIDLVRNGHATAVGAATGAVVGLVAITPAAGFVTPRAAILIGGITAGISYAAIQWRPRTRIDDALDVFACHGVAGIAGAVLTGVFATKTVNAAGADGLLAGNAGLVWTQIEAVLAAMALSGGLTFVILRALEAFMGLRVTLADEIGGVDVSEHGEEAYHGGDIGELVGRGMPLGESVVLEAPTPTAVPVTPRAI
ncbi:MAG: ammonium transporter [Gemmatimonadaceae bacterium]|nr:ammonium transporter [Gemmatimonadaceae bacterium]